MAIDMRGFKVVYENQAYACISIDPYYDAYYDDNMHRPRFEKLRVVIINHEAQIDVLEDDANCFAFLKDHKNA